MSAAAGPTFEYQDLFEQDHHTDTPFKKLSSDHVRALLVSRMEVMIDRDSWGC